jgi:uncharacterized protein (TIGR02996 family)
MSDEAALLNAIIAHVDEDTPRLAYADWLDEHNRTVEAEFVRLQCRLSTLSPADSEWAGHIDRETDLLWRGPMRNPPLPPAFQLPNWLAPPYRDEVIQFIYRGFPFFASVSPGAGDRTPEHFADELARLFETTPIRGIDCSALPADWLERVVDCPAFGEVRGLRFGQFERHLPLATWKKLVDSPGAERIEQLSVRSALTAEVLAAFAPGRALSNLRRFEIWDLHAPPSAIRAWLGGAWARQLRYAAPVVPRQPDVAAALAAGLAELPELHSLHAAHQTAEHLAHLPAASFPGLAALRVWGERYTIDRFRELLRAEWFGRVRALDLGGLGDQAVSALAKHPVAKELFLLRLYNSTLGKAGLRTIARPGAFPRLVALDLARHPLHKTSATPEVVRAFLSELTLPNLKRLTLSWLPIGDEGAKALAANTGLPGLKYLSLDRCHIGPEGQKALAESPLVRAEISCKSP